MINIEANKKRFTDILLETKRENIDYVIECLDQMGFFEAPASVANHLNEEGGLVQHSLNVYDEAMGLKEIQTRLNPGIGKELNDESIAIAALLHDVCKADLYVKTIRQRKEVDGTWTKGVAYAHNDEAFPAGHGEKSVIMLLQWGLDLSDEELLAIRWHMGAWNIPFQSLDIIKNNDLAKKKYPLVTLISAADSLAAAIIE